MGGAVGAATGGLGVIGSAAVSSAVEKVVENGLNGNNLTQGVGKAAVQGAAMGKVSDVAGKAISKGANTVTSEIAKRTDPKTGNIMSSQTHNGKQVQLEPKQLTEHIEERHLNPGAVDATGKPKTQFENVDRDQMVGQIMEAVENPVAVIPGTKRHAHSTNYYGSDNNGRLVNVVVNNKTGLITTAFPDADAPKAIARARAQE